MRLALALLACLLLPTVASAQDYIVRYSPPGRMPWEPARYAPQFSYSIPYTLPPIPKQPTYPYLPGPNVYMLPPGYRPINYGTWIVVAPQ